ncbi:RNA polymerase sigma factor (sigma-70 family) [Breznakia sp. PF5-3]|uniref:RNA polymerase sigma factor n=1 Tax=unclassified Breznakia TaxID=2623764 RepID=UPI002407608B|nr:MULTISPECIES: sigma-70 family RNA polymerase sigma factor [unclassified Breznakia]MDL2276861.1 sigma-70 family RNA polymerase sigma factor [Breznakia sp. OttesenSCG-928-G09]MDF9825767.1 RNA polymerase sigma factor (sigma-70 family) [Breznakia sp. PM6-1]MDF9836572.1 RNA polymerase sigma factor (sigma-70 family) [Breznakia sp. PF5-3]MDF9838821.1 RNA polymerase sigma factor (sigma-70 family) [Breznakia sp. PFB2-8]MDF9860845.1 RNA polymerase sigma factor (sigma-70 family) [Breznakia sp. PH5-24]
MSNRNEQIKRLYLQHVDMVFRICFLFLKNEADAKDGVQDIFVKLIEKDIEFTSDEHEKAWIIRVSINYCKDQLRKVWNKRKSDIPNLEEFFGINNHHDQYLLSCILQLPTKYKDIIYLHYYEGYTIEEISKIQNISSSTLRSRLSKAKYILKERFEKEESYERV